MSALSTRKGCKQTAVLNLLRDSSTEKNVAQIASLLDIGKSAVARHCKVLREVGAIYRRKIPVGNGLFVSFYVIAPAYNGSFEPAKKAEKVHRVDRIEGKGTQRFITQVPMSGQIGAGRFLCDKELTPRIAPKPYVPPANNPNYTPRHVKFMSA